MQSSEHETPIVAVRTTPGHRPFDLSIFGIASDFGFRISDFLPRHSNFGFFLSAILWLSVVFNLDAAGPQPSAEVRNVILMLDNGPLHLRLHISIGRMAPTEVRKATVERMMKTLDSNGDGKLSRDEAQRSPLFREKQRPGAAEFVKSLGADLAVSPKDIEKQIEKLGGETVVYRQNLATSDTDDQVFKSLDVNDDRVLSEAEMFDAVDKLLMKDNDDDECVTLEDFALPPANPVMPIVQTPVADAAKAASASIADLIRDTQQTLLPAQLIKKYDTNRDTKLSADELHWSKEKIASCDTDKDGQLSTKELANLKNLPVDIELAVDVAQKAGEPMLRVIGMNAGGTDEDRFPDSVTVRLQNVVITFSTREVDPFEESMSIALRTFNELDIDNNGYLDKKETMARERFDRGLFDQIDADGDGKIFGEEMKEFIRTRGEPAASTCQVTAFNDGAGFFSALDTNHDRRLSMREMRYADKTLAKMEFDGKPGLSKDEPRRQYRIEFLRGVFNPFGNPERIVNRRNPQTAAEVVKPRAVGPIWFQRWDRNNDGDITWREFLGPRDAFEQIDTDGDDLIDPKEAAAASELAKSTSGKSKQSSGSKLQPANQTTSRTPQSP